MKFLWNQVSAALSSGNSNQVISIVLKSKWFGLWFIHAFLWLKSWSNTNAAKGKQ